MKQPDFTQMTRQELKAYIKKNPTNDEAIRELFVNRRSSQAKTYPFPYEMTEIQLTDIFRRKDSN